MFLIKTHHRFPDFARCISSLIWLPPRFCDRDLLRALSDLLLECCLGLIIDGLLKIAESSMFWRVMRPCFSLFLLLIELYILYFWVLFEVLSFSGLERSGAHGVILELVS